jgi:hypothetical protein
MLVPEAGEGPRGREGRRAVHRVGGLAPPLRSPLLPPPERTQYLTGGVPWGWGCIEAGIQVDGSWVCGCGFKPRKKDFTALRRPSGLVVCVECARYLYKRTL